MTNENTSMEYVITTIIFHGYLYIQCLFLVYIKTILHLVVFILSNLDLIYFVHLFYFFIILIFTLYIYAISLHCFKFIYIIYR